MEGRTRECLIVRDSPSKIEMQIFFMRTENSLLTPRMIPCTFRTIMKLLDLNTIRERRAQASQDLVVHQQMVDSLRADIADLDVAERLFEKFGREIPDTHEAENGPAGEDDGARTQPSEKTARRKPPNIPTTVEMIQEALVEAHSGGSPGLEPSEILSWVRERYWPEAMTNDIGPDVWRLWKIKKLHKDGKVYSLPEDWGTDTASPRMTESVDRAEQRGHQ
jgi:hypothetical protein